MKKQTTGKKNESKKSATRQGSQTLFRGLDVIDAVADGETTLATLSECLGLTRSTTHRLASALVDRKYLTFVPRGGYGLGPKLIELGYRLRDKLDLPRVAAPYLAQLAEKTEDTVLLGVADRGMVLFLDKIAGKRRLSIRSRIGEVQPMTSSVLGKALLLDQDETAWKKFYQADRHGAAARTVPPEWLKQMRSYVRAGFVFDAKEDADQIRSVAAPIRDVEGKIVAAISVSAAASVMDERRMLIVSRDVAAMAMAISRDFGWSQIPPRKAVPKAK